MEQYYKEFINNQKDSKQDKDKLDSKYNFKYTPNPQVWGPKMWYMLHNFSLFLPETITDRGANHYKNFIRSMPYLIPCQQCRNHCCDLLSQYTDKQLFNICKKGKKIKTFFVHLHNFVNMKLNKPQFNVEQLYENVQL